MQTTTLPVAFPSRAGFVVFKVKDRVNHDVDVVQGVEYAKVGLYDEGCNIATKLEKVASHKLGAPYSYGAHTKLVLVVAAQRKERAVLGQVLVGLQPSAFGANAIVNQVKLAKLFPKV
jgi:hypothetical protein